MQRFCKLITICISFLFILFISCKNNINRNDITYSLPDTLKIGTIYSPTTFFIFRGDTLGYEYERILNFTSSNNITAKFIIYNNLSEMIEMLDSGKIDIIAYEVPIINEYKNIVLHCGTENITNQVLVQQKNKDLILNVTQLVGKDIYVTKDSKYELRLKNLDNELGGGIVIHSLNADSIIPEDLIKLVSEGKISYTIIDRDIAKLNKTYFKNIDINLPVSFEQRASWAVNKHNYRLAEYIDTWSKQLNSQITSKQILKRYFELSKNEELTSRPKIDIKNGIISEYDHIFKKYAKEIHWDWKLLAAQAWSESHFDTAAVSWAGAKGLMQLMPSTARAYGVSPDNITNPELNIKAAVANIKDLNSIFSSKILDEQERIKFILAAYNSGAGHILDAIALAKKYGKDPQKWSDNVNITLQWKANPEYFNDNVCKFGYFRGSQTIAYVKKVEDCYNYFSTKIK